LGEAAAMGTHEGKLKSASPKELSTIRFARGRKGGRRARHPLPKKGIGKEKKATAEMKKRVKKRTYWGTLKLASRGQIIPVNKNSIVA